MNRLCLTPVQIIRLLTACLLWVALVGEVCSSARAQSPPALTTIPLSGTGWTLTEAGSADAIPASVPGCVHLDLRAAEKISDPVYRDNETKLQWVSDRTWVYARRFDVAADVLERKHVELHCDGLETFAHIEVNGQRVADTDNMFRIWTFDVRPLLHAGENDIRITFDPISAVLERKRTAAKDGPAGSFIDGLGDVRVEPCSGGWDFGPKYITAGIWRPIALVAWDQEQIESVSTAQDLADVTKARVKVNVRVKREPQSDLAIRTSLSLCGQQVDATQLSVASEGTASTELIISKPQLWWPSGMGPQPLYDLTIETVSAGTTVDRVTKRIGLRTVELLPKTDSRPLTLAINHVPIFAKGASFVPADIFPTAATPKRLRDLVAKAKAANMNMLRCWGGGYYEDDALYDACDEAGILVWFDFKFACSAYPVNDPDWLATTTAECDDQIRRLSHHPSIAVWCGNNEVEALVNTYKTMRQVDYDKLFHAVLPGELRRLAPDSQYVGGSPEAGDEHNWAVWHMGAPFENYRESHGWTTEFGFQSFPEPRTVASYATDDDRASLNSPVMTAHQHNGNGRGNAMIQEMMDQYFRPAKDIDSALWLSQINQAMGLTLGVRHWRGDWPRSSGALVWQLNDVWPAPTWSIIDYFGRPKAAMYRLRHAFADVSLDAKADPRSGEVTLNVVSDRRTAFDAAVHWKLSNFEGRQIRDGALPVQVPAGVVSLPVSLPSFAEDFNHVGRRNLLLQIELKAGNQALASDLLTFAKPKDLKLFDPQLHREIKVAPDGGFDVTIHNTRPALYAWLDAGIDARFSDNFIDLSAEQVAMIHVTPRAPLSLEQFEKALVVRSLYDLCDYPHADAGKPIIAQARDGSMLCAAETAEIIGDSATLEADSPPNIGRWTDAHDLVEWRMHVDRPGAFRVAAITAQPFSTESKRTLSVAIGDQHLSAALPISKSWTDYNEVSLGVVEIKHAGDYTITLHPGSVAAGPTAGGALMNLRSLSLRPVELP